jgi:uncharacterized protein YfdQ (DUF2303 family)
MSDESKSITDAEVIFGHGMDLADPRKPDGGREFIVLPKNSNVHDLERLLERPTRKRGLVTLHDLESFNRYVKAFGLAGTQIFAAINPAGACIEAILDYHEARGSDAAGWGEHRAIYPCEQTVEWKRWISKNEQWLPQAEFAAFIEDHIEEIVDPSGATMLEIAKTLEARSNVEFKSGVRLDNGDHSLKFVVETKTTAGGNGELTVPAEFALGIAPFNGGPPYRVRARLRYRINDQRLFLRYELIQPHKVIEAACKELVATITAETGIAPLLGVAPKLSLA